MASYIQEGLYLGGVDDAYQTEKLEGLGITHILSIDMRPLRKEVMEKFRCLYVHALDMETYDLLSHFEECIDFIDEGRQKGGVLVHCYFGQSRSATIVLAYLMQKLDLNLDDALTLVMRQRSHVKPNPGFRVQLEIFEAMGNRIEPSSAQFKLYRLNNLALRMQTSQIQGSLPEDSMSLDPSLGELHAGETLYRCKKCRRPLFQKSAVLLHSTGQGEAAFDWRGRLPCSQYYHGQDEEDQADIQCTKSLFIEPVQWMHQDIMDLEGKLSCPKCLGKLGSFNWAGERCPCGSWVTPAFHIQNSKVDMCQIPKVPPHRPPLKPPPLRSSSKTSDSSIDSSIDSDLTAVDGVVKAVDLVALETANNGTVHLNTDEQLPPLE